MDEETLKTQMVEYIKVTKRWTELVAQGEQIAAALWGVADGVRLPRNENAPCPRPDRAHHLIAQIPHGQKMQSFLEEAKETFDRKRELYKSLRDIGAPITW